MNDVNRWGVFKVKRDHTVDLFIQMKKKSMSGKDMISYTHLVHAIKVLWHNFSSLRRVRIARNKMIWMLKQSVKYYIKRIVKFGASNEIRIKN